MRARQKPLFSEGGLAETLEAHARDAERKIGEIRDARFRKQSEESLVDELTNEYAVHPLLIDLGSVKKRIKEIDRDVSGDVHRHIPDRSRPFYVKGLEYSCEYRYSGDSLLWKLRPNHWSSVLPYGDVASDTGGRDGSIRFIAMGELNAAPEQLTRGIESELETVQKYVAWQVAQIEDFNRSLASRIGAVIARRAQNLRSTSSLAAALGASFDDDEATGSIKKSKDESVPSRAVANKSRAKHDLFISHATEDKVSFVRPLAKALQARGLDVWLDETELKLGDSLRRSIDKGLSTCRYGVVVLSQPFFKKSWPQYELDGLVAREIGGIKVVLPIWHGISRDEIVNFSPTLADRMAVDTAQKSVEEIADAIASVVRD